MSGRELQRIEVLSEVLARRRSEISAAAILGLSTRQTRRLLTAYRDGGGGALIHKARGRAAVAHPARFDLRLGEKLKLAFPQGRLRLAADMYPRAQLVRGKRWDEPSGR